jgi:hypothetical protein
MGKDKRISPALLKVLVIDVGGHGWVSGSGRRRIRWSSTVITTPFFTSSSRF